MSMRYKGGVISATAPVTTTSTGIWTLAQQMQAVGGSVWPTVPGAPTIGTATVASGTSASVPFSAPACAGYPGGITGYTATSTPGCVSQTGVSSPLVVSGLTTGTAYTFKVKATNATGTGAQSAASNSVTPSVIGQCAYTTPGSYTWVAPAGVTSVSVVVVGAGARNGGGGGLGYRNNYTVVPATSYNLVVGGSILPSCAGESSSFNSGAFGAGGGANTGGGGGAFGTVTGGGAGGSGAGGGGGGAAGYSGCGGAGGTRAANGTGTTGGSGTGGGGGGGGGSRYDCINAPTANINPGGGGGVGILGQGSSGAGGYAGGTYNTTSGGGGAGSGGVAGGTGTACARGTGGAYGGGGSASGGGAGSVTTGGGGAVRIIYPGTTRSFPSTCTGNL